MFDIKPHPVNKEKNFISGYYISPDLCDKISELFSSKNRLKFNPKHKQNFRNYLHHHLDKLSQDLYDQYREALNVVLNLYGEEYKFFQEKLSSNLQLEKNIIQMQWYDPKCYYSNLHCENYSNQGNEVDSRVLVFMTYLNDIADGGGTEFPTQNVSFKSEKGLTLLWPAYWTHPHRGIVSNTEHKFILTGWFNHKSY